MWLKTDLLRSFFVIIIKCFDERFVFFFFFIYYRQYGKEIRGFLQDLVSKTSKQATDSSFSDVILEIWDKTEKCNRQISEANEDIGDSKDTSSLFTIDTQPTLKSDIDIPKYRKVYYIKFAIMYISYIGNIFYVVQI